jgi:hypothetical protein
MNMNRIAHRIPVFRITCTPWWFSRFCIMDRGILAQSSGSDAYASPVSRQIGKVLHGQADESEEAISLLRP